MKIAVFSDVQANLPAMESAIEHILDWQPDRVFMNGDLVNRGPRSLECLELFNQAQRDHGWEPIRGNHEDFVLYCGSQQPKSEFDAAMRRFTDWTVNQMEDAASVMRDWPDHIYVPSPDLEAWMHITHGSLAGNRVGILRRTTDEELETRLSDKIALFVTAHTHRPLERNYKQTRILNVGSIGSPFDGDERSSYGQIEFKDNGWATRIARFPYDRQRADDDYHSTGFLENGGPFARMIYEEWRQARSLLPHWHRNYRPAVEAGDISIDDSIDHFLDEFDPADCLL